MVHILIINGSARPNGNSSIMAEYVEAGVKTVSNVQVHMYEFAGKEFSGCKGVCQNYCKQHGICLVKDDLISLWEEFVWADGIIWVVPVYHVGPPGQVKCAMDRLCNMQWSRFGGKYPRWNKVIGCCAQGAARWGGQELAIQWLIESAILMKCIPVAGDPPASYFGVAGCAKTWDKKGILEDENALELSTNIGKRVAELARIIKLGIIQSEKLDTCYYPYQMLENEVMEVENI